MYHLTPLTCRYNQHTIIHKHAYAHVTPALICKGFALLFLLTGFNQISVFVSLARTTSEWAAFADQDGLPPNPFNNFRSTSLFSKKTVILKFNKFVGVSLFNYLDVKIDTVEK